MKTLQLMILTGVVAILVLGLVTGSARATPDLTEKENLVCTTCHDKPGSKLLTDKGKYYEEMRSFEGFDEIIAAFQRCTACHVKKPGSVKLTRTGRHFAGTIGGMSELCNWIRPDPETSGEAGGEPEIEDGPGDAEVAAEPPEPCS